MDDSISSIDENNRFVLTETEKAALADFDRFYKEADEDLKDAFHKFAAENELEEETDSESGYDEDQKRNLLNDGSFVSEVDKYSASLTANDILHQSNSECENMLEKGDSYHETDESGAFRPSHSALISHVSNEYDCSSTTKDASQNSTDPNYPNENNSVTDAFHERELNSETPIHSAISSSSINVNGLKEEYQKLFTLCETTFQELIQMRANQMNYKKETDNALKTLKLNLDFLESEKDKLGYNLQDSQNFISYYEQGSNKSGEIMALKSQLLSICKIKDEIQDKLESSKDAIYSLEMRLNDLEKTDHLPQHCDHYNDSLEERKLHHEKEILSCSQNINKLQSQLNSKIEEAEDWALKNSELQNKYQQLEIEKNEWVNKMSKEFVAQKKCQLFLESGTIEEINRLKLQVQQLEEEKSNIERENSLLKESFLRRWARSLLSWQLNGLRRVNDVIGLPFF